MTIALAVFSPSNTTGRYALALASPSIGPEFPAASSEVGNQPAVRMDSGSGLPPVQPSADEKRWSSFLPFMAEEAKKRGYQLPLPFGVSTVFTGLLGRKIDVTDVRVGVNGATPQSVNQFIDLGSTSAVFNANLKLDAWLLPFLNVYFLAGYVYNESTTRATITVPRPGPLPGKFHYTQDIKTTLEGFVGGGGMTRAAGDQDFFLVADANYSQTDMGFDDRFKAIIATIRAGYQAKLAELPLQMWVGQGYWNTSNTAKGHADVPGVGRIQFEADQGPTYPWMTDFGANLHVTRHIEMVLDFGVDWHGGYLAVVAPTLRL
ncbi:MAG TPA: hypothetical protein VLM19_09420 [Nitrospiraceae bacterium]|nr:hypothetical protein [Nitrospiraceae bacterium]